jgi:MinD-like ATPase involved in chromosome partitioning or flagellar assembly
MPRKCKLISLLSNKGGVGKTTIATGLAACLAQLSPGENVVVVDCDPGSRTTSMLLGQGATMPRHDIFDYFNDPSVFPEDVVVRSSVLPNLLLIPNTRGSELHPRLKNKDLIRKKLTLLLEFLDEHASYAVVDLPAGKTSLHFFFAMISTCYLVVKPTKDSLLAADEIVVTMSNLAMKVLKSDERLIDGVIANAVIRGEENKVVNYFRQKHDLDVVTIVPHSPGVEEAIESWKILTIYRPEDPAAVAIRQLAGKVAERENWETLQMHESRDRRRGRWVDALRNIPRRAGAVLKGIIRS